MLETGNTVGLWGWWDKRLKLASVVRNLWLNYLIENKRLVCQVGIFHVENVSAIIWAEWIWVMSQFVGLSVAGKWDL